MKYHFGYNFKRGREGKALDSELCPLCGKLIKKNQMNAHIAKNNCTEKSSKKAQDSDDVEHFSQVEMDDGLVEVGQENSLNEAVHTKKVKVNKKQTDKEVVKLHCDQCERVFQRKSNLRKHIVLAHSGNSRNEIEYDCEFCHKKFKTNGNLKKHKMCVHDKVKFPCDQCDHQASDPSNLINHKKTTHEGIKYPCDQCDFISTQSSNLNAHKKAKHSFIDHMYNV